MKVIAVTRQEQGTGASRRLRNAGTTPGIVYGGGKPAVNIKIDHNPLIHALKREAFHTTILDLEIDGVSEPVVLRDYQMHAFKPLVMHIDFQRVVQDQPIAIRVPLNYVNAEAAPASKQGGSTISRVGRTVGIRCLPKDLPAHIDVDLSNLNPGGIIRLADVPMPAGVKATDDPKTTLATASKAK